MPARAVARTAASAPAHVHVDHLHRVLGAHRVHAGDVVDDVAAAHPGFERGLVERVAARDLRALRLEGCGGRIGARERGDLALLEQRGQQRAAEEPAPAGQKGARHQRSVRASEKRLK